MGLGRYDLARPRQLLRCWGKSAAHRRDLARMNTKLSAEPQIQGVTRVGLQQRRIVERLSNAIKRRQQSCQA